MASEDSVTRRSFLAGVAATATTAAALARLEAQSAPAIPIIDTHIHLFDPTRPQGAPYSGPPTPGVAPIPSFPDRYRKLAVPLGIVGAVKVEASPWIEDNLWVLQIAQTDPIIVGVIGNLEPEKPEFAEYLDRYRKNPLFRGIRCGNLWGRNFTAQAENPAFVAGLKRVADADLVVDLANPNLALLRAAVRLTDQVPGLRVVLDHLPAYDPTATDQSAYDAVIRELARRPLVFAKLSSIIHRVGGQVPATLAAYRPRVDALLGLFGEDRVLFGSDWPNSDGVTTIDRVVAVAKEYFSTQPRGVAEKYFWRNSTRAYKWVRRDPTQPA
ncbi:MAG: amidohydrolase family protein [Vicinamibacterales bacterium]